MLVFLWRVMMKKILFVSGSILLMAGCATAPKPDVVGQINQDLQKSPTSIGAGVDDWARGYILVQPRAGLSKDHFDEIVRGKGGRSLGRLGNLPIHKIKVPEHAEDAVVRALSKNPSIKFAEKDMIVSLTETIPDDPRYSDEWHLSKIQAPLAWDISQGDGITIAVLDTGVYAAHPDLSSKMLDGWNVVSNNSDIADINGHGTKVASFVGAATNNGVGVASVGFNANILPIKVSNLESGSASYSSLANGITWAADNGAQVANLSYQAYKSSTVTTAAKYMRNKGGLVVCSSGNSNIDTGYSNNASVITVGATNSSDVRAYFSNYGDYVDVAAPGRSVLAATNSGGYESVSGTSFSAPITAGVVGLIMSANPNLSPDQVETILESSADDLIAGVDWHMYYGHGRINASKAVQMALETSAADTEAPVVSVFSPSSGSIVKGNVSVEVSASDNSSVNEVSLYANGMLVATDTLAPYQFSWDSSQEADGMVTLTANAIDASLNEGVSQGHVVEVQNIAPVDDIEAPVVSISNPVDGSSVKRTVNIYVDASDNVQVAEIQLSINGSYVSSVAGSSLSYGWNTRKVDDGQYNITAVATDTSGNVSAVESVVVTVGTTTTTTTKGRKK